MGIKGMWVVTGAAGEDGGSRVTMGVAGPWETKRTMGILSGCKALQEAMRVASGPAGLQGT
jgi:hypothetical protein